LLKPRCCVVLGVVRDDPQTRVTGGAIPRPHYR
jgi:hypothetical protein